MTIRNCTDKELQEEIDRRNVIAKPAPPKMKTDIDLAPLQKLLIDYVDEIKKPDFCSDNDFDHYIYETAIDTFYGKEFWTWYNNLNN